MKSSRSLLDHHSSTRYIPFGALSRNWLTLVRPHWSCMVVIMFLMRNRNYSKLNNATYSCSPLPNWKASRCCSCSTDSLKCTYSAYHSSFPQILNALDRCWQVSYTSFAWSLCQHLQFEALAAFSKASSSASDSCCTHPSKAYACIGRWHFSSRLDCLREAAMRWLYRPFDESFGLKRGRTGFARSQAWAHRLISGDCCACSMGKHCYTHSLVRPCSFRSSVPLFSRMLYLWDLQILPGASVTAFQKWPNPLFAPVDRTEPDGSTWSLHSRCSHWNSFWCLTMSIHHPCSQSLLHSFPCSS